MNHTSSPSRHGSAFPEGGKYTLFSELSISCSGRVNSASRPAVGGCFGASAFLPLGQLQLSDPFKIWPGDGAKDD